MTFFWTQKGRISRYCKKQRLERKVTWWKSLNQGWNKLYQGYSKPLVSFIESWDWKKSAVLLSFLLSFFQEKYTRTQSIVSKSHDSSCRYSPFLILKSKSIERSLKRDLAVAKSFLPVIEIELLRYRKAKRGFWDFRFLSRFIIAFSKSALFMFVE